MNKENVTVPSRDFNSEILFIINDMNLKSNRFRDMDSQEIHEKLYSTDLQKIGEYFEFMEEYRFSEGRLTAELALEIADIVYYTSQPNCLIEDKKLSTEIENMVGIGHDLAQRFCILKYSYRAYEFKGGDNYKVIERERMVNFLNNKNLGILE